MASFTQTRAPSHAGQFYPAAPAQLRRALAGYLQPATGTGTAPAANVRAMIVPHAGYVYSGATAGKAYARAAQDAPGTIRRVLLLTPAHYVPVGGISLGDYAHLATPLGELTVDTEACRQLLAASPLFCADAGVLAPDHTLDVQLPFIQTALPGVTVIPAIVGHLGRADIAKAAAALKSVAGDPHTLWVISSDFTHYGRSFDYVPFTADMPKRLEELDLGAVRYIEALDTDGFLDYVARTGATICGATPIAVLLAALAPDKAALQPQLLEYTTSGKLTHDYEHTVSYVALVFTGANDSDRAAGSAATAAALAAVGAAAPAPEYALSDAEKQFLLRLARSRITAKLEKQQATKPNDEDLTPRLKAHGAAFVTLQKHGNLRGCIGDLEAAEPLYRNVMHNAMNAAFEDPRFPPLRRPELDDIEIEISVLTPPRPIASLDEFVLGRHGIILEKGRTGAVFLPQVPPEQGWSKEETLTHLALKAGMPPDGWRRNASFFVFEAIVFSEAEHGQPADA